MSAAAKALDLLLETIGSKEQSAMALNLSAQLAAVARAAMAWRKGEGAATWSQGSAARLEAALDALEAAAEGA